MRLRFINCKSYDKSNGNCTHKTMGYKLWIFRLKSECMLLNGNCKQCEVQEPHDSGSKQNGLLVNLDKKEITGATLYKEYKKQSFPPVKPIKPDIPPIRRYKDDKLINKDEVDTWCNNHKGCITVCPYR